MTGSMLGRMRPRRSAAYACATLLYVSALACGGAAPQATDASGAASNSADEAWRVERPAAAEARGFEYPSAQTSRLPNGVELYLVPKKSGTVALSISSRSGGSSTEPGKSGLSALTLRMMSEATVKRDNLALAIAAESLGASIDFDTGRDGSSLSLEVLTSDAPLGLALLSEVVNEPRFAPDDFARIKAQWLDSLVSERQDPARLSSLAGMRALLGPKAAAPVRGSVPDVTRLTRDDLLRFHRQHYVSGNLAVLAVGDLTMERLTELASQSFGHLPAQAPPALPPLDLAAPPSATSVWVIDRPGSVQSALFVGQPFPDRATPGHEARQVMNNLLGGLFTSRLNLNLREKHAYTYGARSVAISTQRWGALIAMSSIKTESTADALEQLIFELSTLQKNDPNPLSADELNRARTDLSHQLSASLEHVRRILGDTGELYVDRLPADYHAKFASQLQLIDEGKVRAEAARLTPDRLVVVIVGDKQQIAPLLSAKNWTIRDAPDALIE